MYCYHHQKMHVKIQLDEEGQKGGIRNVTYIFQAWSQVYISRAYFCSFYLLSLCNHSLFKINTMLSLENLFHPLFLAIARKDVS